MNPFGRQSGFGYKSMLEDWNGVIRKIARDLENGKYEMVRIESNKPEEKKMETKKEEKPKPKPFKFEVTYFSGYKEKIVARYYDIRDSGMADFYDIDCKRIATVNSYNCIKRLAELV